MGPQRLFLRETTTHLTRPMVIPGSAVQTNGLALGLTLLLVMDRILSKAILLRTHINHNKQSLPRTQNLWQVWVDGTRSLQDSPGTFVWRSQYGSTIDLGKARLIVDVEATAFRI